MQSTVFALMQTLDALQHHFSTLAAPKAMPPASDSGWVGNKGIISAKAMVATKNSGPAGPSASIWSCKHT